MRMKFSDFLVEWLENRRPYWRSSTFESVCVYVYAHIKPYFDEKGIDLSLITARHIRDYVHFKMTDGRKDGKPGGLGHASVRKHLSVIKQCLDEAVCLDVIPHNPAGAVKLPRVSTLTDGATFLNQDEAQRLINAFQDSRYKPCVVMALYYGLRRSEVLGLKWSAIDFENNLLYIRHTVVKCTSIHSEDNTKTPTSHRQYTILPEVCEMLLALKKEQETAGIYEADGYLFRDKQGRVMRPDCLTRGFQRVLKAHHLPNMRFHDLRHSTASILFDKGWSEKDVQEWLGHSDIETTLNIYVHYSRGRKILCAERLKGMFKI